MNFDKSRQAMKAARALIPGGVNSPVRAFGSVGGDPVFIDRAQGAYLHDLDGNKYIDYVGSWGPAIVGHAHPEVVEAIGTAMRRGLTFGAPTEGETRLAGAINQLYPSMEMVRLVSSGTEACMAALRVARAFTKREKILKFSGCYPRPRRYAAGEGRLRCPHLGPAGQPGVPSSTTKDTLTATYNDLDAVHEVFAQNKEQIAVVIIEPIIGNAGFIRPVAGFLEGLRDICSAAGTLLLFDEVMTGCRVSLGGMQALCGIKPDITTLGKVIGGGMPLAAYGGRRDIMDLIAPSGPVYQAGTLSGNPLAVASGLKTLDLIGRPQAFPDLTKRTRQLVQGLEAGAKQHNLPFSADCEGGMFGFFFHPGPVTSLEAAKQGNVDHFKTFFHSMLRRGVYLAPSAFEAGFVSMAHTKADIERTLECANEAFKDVARA